MKKITFNKKFFKLSIFALVLFLVFGSYSTKAEAYAWQNGYWTAGNVTSSQIVCVGATPDAVNLAWANVPGALSYTVARNNGSIFATFNNNVFFGTYTDWDPVPKIQNTYQIQAFSGLNGSGSTIDFVDHTSDIATCPSVSSGTSSSGPFSTTPLTLTSGQSLYVFLTQTEPWTSAPGNMSNCVFSIPSGTPSGVIYSGAVAGGFTPTAIDSSHPFYPSTSGSTYQLSCTRSTGTVVSSSVVVTGYGGGGTPPPPPTITSASPGACGTGNITVSWSSVSGATLYEIRDGASSIVYSGSNTSFTHSSLPAGSSHSYYARVTTASGTSIWSLSATNATAPATCSGGTVNFQGSNDGSSYSGGNIYLSSGQNFWYQWTSTGAPSCFILAPVNSNVGTSGTTGPIAPGSAIYPSATGTTYTMQCPSGGTSDSFFAQSVPNAPSGVTTVSAGCGTVPPGITVNWSTTTGATSYTILRSTTFNGTYTQIASGRTGNSYYDNVGLTAGSWYYYKVRAVNAAGNSADSLYAGTAAPVSSCGGGPYTVNASGVGNGSISPGTRSVTSGNTTTFSVSPTAGFNATMSTDCAGGVGSPASGSAAFTYTTQAITSDCSVTATFTATSSTTGSVTANNCTIALGASSCNTSVIWSTTPPAGVSQVTSNKNDAGVLSAGFVIGNTTSGGPISKPVFGGTPSGTRGFFLYNNGNLIDSVNPSANCIVGSTWNGTICAANAPDLTASAPNSTSATIGTPVSFSSNSVSNIGTANTNVGFNNLWQVNNGSNGGGSTTSNVSVNAMAALPPASSYNATSSPYIFTSGGIYSVRICADMNNLMVGTITEPAPSPLGEFNNCSPWTDVSVPFPPSPDLTILPANEPTPTSANMGVSTTINSVVSNIGTLTSGASFTNIFQFDNDANHGTVTGYRLFTTAGPVAGSSSAPMSVSYTFATAGTWYVRACVDNNASFVGTITEPDPSPFGEFNNCSGWVPVIVGSGSSTMSGTLSAPNCTVALGASSCTTTLTWNVSNPDVPLGSNVTSNTNNSGAASPNFVVVPPVTTGTVDSGTKTLVTIPYGSRTFFLNNNSLSLVPAPPIGGGITVTATCASGSWNGSTCSNVTPAPTVTLTATPLTVNPPATTTSLLTWSSSNANTCTGTNFNTGGATSNAVGVVVTPTAPATTYSILCIQNGPPVVQVSDAKTVTVGAGGPKKPIFIEN